MNEVLNKVEQYKEIKKRLGLFKQASVNLLTRWKKYENVDEYSFFEEDFNSDELRKQIDELDKLFKEYKKDSGGIEIKDNNERKVTVLGVSGSAKKFDKTIRRD